ncbi:MULTISPECIES: serine hydrolase [unclassified Kaistella]|uniref:serine hydrolase n=1 Tax=unclassified Kaistella TaxID=2762626 RepID=UPI0027328C77|nr:MULTISPECIES: serine hydrolase [unclassified Kaistella]MDP2455241.1 serine hydrolase [Kaistella sp. SH11-4b]MDP2458088.1 serine hydrolase [Kaistella sp. SH40-3]MDP2461055.1 serine hydrolase [Kaistella sp. SH19-2b]
MLPKTLPKCKIVCVILILLSLTATTSGQSLNTHKLEQYMAAAIKHDYFSGSILISKNGKTVYSKGYGMANFEHQVPNKINTVFLIGSIVKQFTAVSIMQLVEQGKLNLDDSLTMYITNCPNAWKPVTIRNLLTHTSGIMNYSRLADWDEVHSIKPNTLIDVINLVRNEPLLFAPGERFNYSNTNFDLLAIIIERLTSMPFGIYLEKNIFNPLGMKHTGPVNPRLVIFHRASGYYTKLNKYVNAPYENLDYVMGSGSMISTVSDLQLWSQALFTNKLISKKNLSEMFTPFKSNYGYGTETGKLFDKSTVGHSGSQNGFSTQLLIIPEDTITIIVLSNSDKASAGRIAKNLASIMLNKPYKIPTANTFEMLSVAYEKGGVIPTLQLCNELKKLEGENFDEEEALSNLGGDLLDLKKVKDAISIFTDLVEKKPNSSYAHDYLGTAYLQDKNYSSALKYFKKALELDASNKYAKKGIQEVEEAMKN